MDLEIIISVYIPLIFSVFFIILGVFVSYRKRISPERNNKNRLDIIYFGSGILWFIIAMYGIYFK